MKPVNAIPFPFNLIRALKAESIKLKDCCVDVRNWLFVSRFFRVINHIYFAVNITKYNLLG